MAKLTPTISALPTRQLRPPNSVDRTCRFQGLTLPLWLVPGISLSRFRTIALRAIVCLSWCRSVRGRSVGASGNGFLQDCFLDELIHAAGRGPVEGAAAA